MGFIETLSLTREALKEAGRIDLYAPLLEQYEKNIALQEEIRGLKGEIQALKEEVSIKATLRRELNHYISVDPAEKKTGGRFVRCVGIKKNF